MSGGEGGSWWWEPPSLRQEPIKVQGVTVNPGDDVLVPWPGGEERLPYKGWAEINGEVFIWCRTHIGTHGPQPGPHALKDVKIPDLLDGIAREIGAD